MNKNENFVITINRELGSGGRTVGEKLAAKLGVAFYDKALINSLDEKYNLTTEEIEALKGRSQSWWSDFKRTLGISSSIANKESLIDIPDLLTTDEIYKAERNILKDLAKSGSCVITGRSGFFIFSDHPNHLPILIQASEEHRIRRVTQKQGISDKEAKKLIEQIDQMRENYVQKYAGTSRYDTRNYQLVISMDGKTEDEVVDLIMKFIG